MKFHYLFLIKKPAFRPASFLYATIPDEQQDAWIAAGPNYIFVKHGDAYTLKGNTLYQKLNNNLIRAGQDPITVPPVQVAFPYFEIENITAVIDSETPVAQIYLTGTSDYTGYTIMALACHPVNPGKRALQNLILELGPVTFDTDHIDLTATYPSFFADWITGKRVELGLYLISNTSGQATTWQTKQSLITSI